MIGRAFGDAGDIDVVLSAFGQLGSQAELDDDPTAAAELVNVNFAGQVSALTACAAEMRVRKDNAVYGATKAGLDGFAQALGDRLVGTGVDVVIVRPGFVHTAMTEGLTPAPFSTTPDRVADDIVEGIRRKSAIVWSPAILRWLFTVMRHLPRPVWRIVSNR